MFILHSSNKTEHLLEHLALILKTPLSSPMNKEIFLIQSQGMERWLAQQLALKSNIYANFEFLFPGKFFSQMARQIFSSLSTDVFARELMVWRFELLLNEIEDPVFSPLKSYLESENTALKRFQLANNLAQVFDQYQMMRPQMLNDWLRGKLHYDSLTERWQQALWLKLTAQTGEEHRGALWLKTITKFNNSPQGSLSHLLPERISVLGLNTMPPLFMTFLQGLSKHTQVHFYLLNPAQAFWADMVSRKQANLDEFENGHPLLASLGQQGREFQQILLDQPFDVQLDSFEENSLKKRETLTVLEQLQNDILNNETTARNLVNDDSLTIHSCHSRMREVEVLKEQLLHALEIDADLALRDIVVMAPDIQQYSPFISAVFHGIQHGIADRNLRSSNAMLEAYISFLKVTQGRLGWQSVLDLLNQKEIYHCFNLTEVDMARIHYWITEINIRWGQSGEHKEALFNLPNSPENTWLAGLERLLMGYAVGTDESFFEGILPYIEIEGSSALALGGLYDFMTLLFNASDELSKDYSLGEWSKKLLYYADLLFPVDFMDGEQQAEKQQINSILLEPSLELAEMHEQPISLAVILAWLEGRVEESKSTNGFLRGQLTFCSLLPMRSIPFKVIAILGMNEGEFPHVDQYLTFDLLGKYFQAGDRSRRADDRYQFLEIVLSVRQKLIITYIGQSISENEEIPASVVIHELLDIMRDHYQLNDVVIEHPLQSFSAQYFSEDNHVFISYSQINLAIAKALLKKKPLNEGWWHDVLKNKLTNVIELHDLYLFYQHPQRYFLRYKLNIHLENREKEIPEHEPFGLDTLDEYKINHQWIKGLLLGNHLSLEVLKAQGLWLSGTLGQLSFKQKQLEIETFVDVIEGLSLGLPLDNQLIDINIDEMYLVGILSGCYQEGSLFYRYTTMKGKDFLGAWLHHLIINLDRPQITHVICTDRQLCFSVAMAKVHQDSLLVLLAYYQLGQQHPDAFFTEAVFAYIQQQAKAKTTKKPLVSALSKGQDTLLKAMKQAHEPELKLLYKHLDESLEQLLDTDFEVFCNQVLLPVWEEAII